MTVRKISKLAGVSPATVSRVINRNPCVAPHLVATVQAAMKELGHPESSAGNLGRPRKNVSGSVGDLVAMLFPDSHKGPMFTTLGSRLCQGVEKALRDRGLNLLITGLDEENRLPEAIAKHKVAGVIIRGQLPFIPKVPFVMTLEPSPLSDLTRDVVAEDNVGIGLAAGRLLAERGHRQLGVILPEANHPSLELRAVLFKHFADSQGATVRDFRVNWGDDLAALADQCLAAVPELTGFFIAGHDNQTLQLIRLLRERSARLGRAFDVVCCHNDVSQVAVMDPEALVLDIQAEEIGRAAVDLLLWRRQNLHAPCRKIVVPHRLVKRPENPPPGMSKVALETPKQKVNL